MPEVTKTIGGLGSMRFTSHTHTHCCCHGEMQRGAMLKRGVEQVSCSGNRESSVRSLNQWARQCYMPTPSLGKLRWNELECFTVCERDRCASLIKTDSNSFKGSNLQICSPLGFCILLAAGSLAAIRGAEGSMKRLQEQDKQVECNNK